MVLRLLLLLSQSPAFYMPSLSRLSSVVVGATVSGASHNRVSNRRTRLLPHNFSNLPLWPLVDHWDTKLLAHAAL